MLLDRDTWYRQPSAFDLFSKGFQLLKFHVSTVLEYCKCKYYPRPSWVHCKLLESANVVPCLFGQSLSISLASSQ